MQSHFEQKIIATILMLLCAIWLHGQPKPTTHYAALWCTGGYSALLYTHPDVAVLGHVGSSMGLGYEYQAGGNFFFQIGTEFTILTSLMRHDDFRDDREMFDTDALPDGTPWYDSVTFHADFHRLHEMQRIGYVQFPLLLGMQFDGWRISVGGKASIALFANYTTRGRCTTTGTYRWFHEDLTDMPNHYYRSNFVVRDNGVLHLGLNIVATLAVDFDITPVNFGNKLLLFGAFCDYGLLDINRSPCNRQFLTYHENPTQFSINSMLNTPDAAHKRVTPLYCGCKLTLRFCVGISRRHTCNCYNTYLKQH